MVQAWKLALRDKYYASANEKILTIPIDDHNMFTLWTQFGYAVFACRPCNNAAVWSGFSGSTLIPNDASIPLPTPNSNLSEPVMEQTREPKRDKEQRECNAKINKNVIEATTITYNNNDFVPDPGSSIELYFTLPTSSKSDI